MRITSRRKKIAFFIVLGVCLVVLALTLNISWIILNWRKDVLLVLGVIFFAAIILGMILNTGFLVREIRRNEQHDSFINAVTHELKTPIDRLIGTVEQVLKAGEVGYKRGTLHRAQTDFSSLVRECMELARTRHHLDPSALQYQGPLNGSGAAVEADPAELRTAVSNILDNAIKYSGDKVDISVRVETPDEKRVVLRVRDRGVGIPAHALKRVFKRFYRVPGRSSSQVKGTGLGLFIVRAIARAHGGRVFAESAGWTRGTTITFELPRSNA